MGCLAASASGSSENGSEGMSEEPRVWPGIGYVLASCHVLMCGGVIRALGQSRRGSSNP